MPIAGPCNSISNFFFRIDAYNTCDFLAIYKKNRQDTITNGEKEIKILVPKKVDVKAIRLKLHLSRQQFANRYGFSIRTLEKWEQGIRVPESAARAYLVVIDRNHKAVEAAFR
jgi:putative transcriptional regulator